MLLKIISIFLMLWFSANALLIFKGKKPIFLKIYGLVVYVFFVVGGYFLFRLDPSAQGILKTALVLYIILLILDGSFQYLVHWLSVNQDRIPALKQAMEEQTLSDEQKKKYHLMQSLIAKKQQGEDTTVGSRSELDQLIDEFEIDEAAASEDISTEDLLQAAESQPGIFDVIDEQVKKKLILILILYSFLILLLLALFYYVRSDSFSQLLM